LNVLAFDILESLVAFKGRGALRDVSKHFILVFAGCFLEACIQEPETLEAAVQALFVDQADHACHDGCGRAGSSRRGTATLSAEGNLVGDRHNIRLGPSIRVELLNVLLHVGYVFRDQVLLPVGHGERYAESCASSPPAHGVAAVGSTHLVLVRIPGGSAHRKHIGAVRGEHRPGLVARHLVQRVTQDPTLLLVEAEVAAAVARCSHQSHAHQPEFLELLVDCVLNVALLHAHLEQTAQLLHAGVVGQRGVVLVDADTHFVARLLTQ